MSSSILVAKPNQQTVLFSGTFVNLSEISRITDLDPSYLSRIFRGERMPTVPKVRKIAGALGMGIDQFLSALDNINKI